jgi:peptidoglycan DL-endopeptidase CwlO
MQRAVSLRSRHPAAAIGLNCRISASLPQGGLESRGPTGRRAQVRCRPGVNRPGPEPGSRADFHSPNPSADPVGGQWKKERVAQVHTPPSVRKIVRQRVAAVTVTVFAAGLLFGVTGSAGAAPAPTVSQVQARIKALQLKENQLQQQYDQVKQELQATDQQLSLVDKEIAVDNEKFAGLRQEIDLIALRDYETGNLNTSIALFASGNPQRILDQSSILEQLSDTNDSQLAAFLAVTRQLTSTRLLALRTKAGTLQLKKTLLERREELNKLLANQNQLLAQLSPADQVGLTGGGGVTTATYTGPTSSQADKAVQYAYDQLGCPYVYGGTGPCADGFDCSGLTMMAWAAAGVSIPRTSYEQLDDLPQVALGDQQPGDILVFLDGGHVGIYVGDNKLIDAPQTGEDVQLVSFTGWYRENLYAIVRP